MMFRLSNEMTVRRPRVVLVVALSLLSSCCKGFHLGQLTTKHHLWAFTKPDNDDDSYIDQGAVILHDQSVIRVSLTETQRTLDVPILLENEHLLVIDKPAGIPHHSTEKEQGILALVREALGPSFPRLYGVHRLDKVTSGILVMAKNAAMARRLTKAFRSGTVIKYYTAISQLKAKKKQGLIQGGMERGRRKSWLLTRSNSETGTTTNFAKTRFFTAGLGTYRAHYLSSAAVVDPKTLLLFRPYTGKTHQLRVAAKSVGLAIAGDPIYRDGFPLADRTYLHSTGLYIPPDDDYGEEIAVWCNPPYAGSLWDETGAQGFQQTLQTLVGKHCDCQPLTKLCHSSPMKLIEPIKLSE